MKMSRFIGNYVNPTLVTLINGCLRAYLVFGWFWLQITFTIIQLPEYARRVWLRGSDCRRSQLISAGKTNSLLGSEFSNLKGERNARTRSMEWIIMINILRICIFSWYIIYTNSTNSPILTLLLEPRCRSLELADLARHIA